MKFETTNSEKPFYWLLFILQFSFLCFSFFVIIIQILFYSENSFVNHIWRYKAEDYGYPQNVCLQFSCVLIYFASLYTYEIVKWRLYFWGTDFCFICLDFNFNFACFETGDWIRSERFLYDVLLWQVHDNFRGTDT